MIPKKIHYCWFGGKPYPRLTEACIASWKTYCPDYELICWDESNSPLEDNLYVRQAYQAKRWAFVSDYIRLWVLERHGGIYLDTDVELVRSLDVFLPLSGFMGFEDQERVATCLIGGIPGHPFFRTAKGLYDGRPFLRSNGEHDDTTNVQLLTDLLAKNGLQRSGMRQNVMDMEIYPSEFFSPKSLKTGKLHTTSNTFAIHSFQASWMTPAQRRNTKIAQVIGPKWTMFIKKRLGRK